MTGNFQDDAREHEMCNLFELHKDESQGRSGIDAYLNIDGKVIPFELKTTSNGSVTTVRDFGPDHIEKWKDKHWLIGFFINGRIHYKYGSPVMMAPWIQSKQKYIALDFMLAELASSKLDLNDMHKIMETKQIYSIDDAKYVQKKQYTIEKYRSLQDIAGGYSQNQMLNIVKDRAKYLIERGSTLNNPHIPLNYFNGWIEIEHNHAEQLRTLVRNYYNEDNHSQTFQS